MKKIFIEQMNTLEIFNIANAMRGIGIELMYWNPAMPLFDLLQINKPDVVVLSDRYFKEMNYAKDQFPNTHFIVLAGSDDVSQIKNAYIVIPVSRIRTFSNPFFYQNSIEKKEYKSYLVYLHTNDRHVDEMQMLILDHLGERYQLKIYGNKVHSPYYLGNPAIEEFGHVLKSANKLLTFDNRWSNNAVMNDTKVIYLDNSIPITAKDLETKIEESKITTELIEKAKQECYVKFVQQIFSGVII